MRVAVELPIPELVENRRRSIATLPTGAPALNRDEALELLEQLKAALLALRKLRTQGVLYRDHERVAAGMARSRARATVVQSPSGTAADELASRYLVSLPITGDTA
jgi:hypothetical protein